MTFDLSSDVQCEGILTYDLDKWLEKNLGISTNQHENFEFEQIFDITENDVYNFYRIHGWDNRIVNKYEKLPNLKSNFATWLLLPKTEKGYHLVTFGSWDRALWHEWYFDTEEERDRFIIHRLFETQKNFWGKKPTVYPPIYP